MKLGPNPDDTNDILMSIYGQLKSRDTFLSGMIGVTIGALITWLANK